MYIWTEPTGAGRNIYALFRKSFELAEVPAQAPLTIFADTRYSLTVNGVRLGHGPARFYVCRPEYDVYDIAPFLNEGENVVAVMVNSYGIMYGFPDENSFINNRSVKIKANNLIFHGNTFSQAC